LNRNAAPRAATGVSRAKRRAYHALSRRSTGHALAALVFTRDRSRHARLATTDHALIRPTPELWTIDAAEKVALLPRGTSRLCDGIAEDCYDLTIAACQAA
jgi:hypothetical protein